jgi:uncharacterized protein
MAQAANEPRANAITGIVPGTERGKAMSDFDRNVASARPYGADRAVAVDAGLRAYMIRVYNTMALGVALTGLVSWFTYQMAGGDAIRVAGGQLVGLTAFGQVIFNPIVMIALLLVPLGMVFFLSFRVHTLSVQAATTFFYLYAALLGLGLAPIFIAYTGASIARVFFITAASFGALSLYGYTTKRDLGPIGAFLMMGLIGIILAMIVNIFLASSALDLTISVIGVLVFAGLTAYDTQRIKEMYDVNDDGTVAGRKAIMGALSLYLDFINLFLMLLRLFGDRR